MQVSRILRQTIEQLRQVADAAENENPGALLALTS
jgi:hypothetical protein